jgi:hypothetical protein
MIDVDQITQLHAETVVKWHQEPIHNAWDGFGLGLSVHIFNYELWH